MKVVDSSGWIEYFVAGPLCDAYAQHLAHPQQLITPTLICYEVYRLIKRELTEEDALLAVAQLGRTRLVELTESLALSAADLGLQYGLAMADSIVYATARLFEAELVTSDSDFAALPHVTYLPKPEIPKLSEGSPLPKRLGPKPSRHRKR